jgi:hypothetical protein
LSIRHHGFGICCWYMRHCLSSCLWNMLLIYASLSICHHGFGICCWYMHHCLSVIMALEYVVDICVIVYLSSLILLMFGGFYQQHSKKCCVCLKCRNCGFKTCMGQIKDYIIDICYFCAKHILLRSMGKNVFFHVQWKLCNMTPEFSNILWHPTKIYGPKVFLLTKIKPDYSDILYNQTYFPGP